MPLIYRFHELVQVYGTTWKELIQEEFGDGIMSAIDFDMAIERQLDPKGDRVRIRDVGQVSALQDLLRHWQADCLGAKFPELCTEPEGRRAAAVALHFSPVGHRQPAYSQPLAADPGTACAAA